VLGLSGPDHGPTSRRTSRLPTARPTAVSLDGLDAMLDERYRREHVRFAVTPFARKPPAKRPAGTVLAEVFPARVDRPCVGAGLAFDAAQERYTRRISSC